MEESAKAVLRQCEEKEIKLQFQPNNLSVNADRHYLVQVLTNLIANAIKYSPRGGAVRVWAQPAVDGTAKFVEISIGDQGPGIPKDKQALIFERFKQVDSRRDKSGGFGLGLTICKQIVDLHGGTIGLQSEVGKGSVFWFKIQAAD